MSQCPVGLSNTHPHPHTQKLGRPTKWLLWFNHLLLLLQRWPNPSSNLTQACIQIFQVYCVEFFPSLLLKRQSRSPSTCSWNLVTITYGRTLWWHGRITALSNTGVTAPQNALHNQPYFSSWLFLKELWFHHGQGLSLSWWRQRWAATLHCAIWALHVSVAAFFFGPSTVVLAGVFCHYAVAVT